MGPQTTQRRRRGWCAKLATAGLLLTTGCVGKAMMEPGTPAASSAVPPVVGDFIQPTGDPASPDACAGVSVAASPASLRRLTHLQQRDSFRDILGDATLNPALEPAAGLIITENEVEKLNLAVNALIATRKHLTYLPCDAAGSFNSACTDTFIAEFGKMAFRRPVRPEEKQWLKQEVYEAVRTHPELSPAATFREAIDAVAQAILQSPQFIYLRKEGEVDDSLPAGVRRLTGYERAAHLSYLLWGSTPDKALLAAAEQGTLDSPDGVKQEATRLLSSPRAKSAVRDFVAAWLELDGNSHQASLVDAPKNATAFPFDSPSLRNAMREEVQSFYEMTFFGSGSFKELMTSRRAYVNKTLGSLYGVTSPPASDNTFAWVDLDSTQRGGLFTRAAFLALYAPQEQKSPIRRGVFLLRHALCQPLGDPPANVNNTPIPSTNHALTVREQVEARTSPSSCQACHSRINPLGFTLENFDAMGRHQTSEVSTYNGQSYTLPVNNAATPLGTDFDGMVLGPVDLSQKLAQSGQARDCMALTWFERASERELTSADACSVQRVMRQFRQTDNMKDLLVTISADDSALFILENP